MISNIEQHHKDIIETGNQITAIAREKLAKKLKELNVVCCDTDTIIARKNENENV